ncbi:MAG TPA: hypothetical protein VGQ60_01625 [Nitrospiraceae bacterium]|nr:hypothetical protein [Nitrospiraceae bacterium]
MRQPSGHLVFYGFGNRRFLATDPDGNPLHECEWVPAAQGSMMLLRARVRLDWEQWVGLRPQGLVNSTVLDLSRKPDWQRLKADDLRLMAAQAMKVSLEEVRFFYGDEDLVIDTRGQTTIRHRKDALYVLDDGTFEHARFMACLSAMHWERIDFLPVVELFQSLLPGTGSAMFELIRGLYDDQNDKSPLPLRYRGIPTYPSEAAFRLFSGFFQPRVAGGGDPFPIFMDVPRSHEVTWLPIPDPPRRYFDQARRLCVTIKGGMIQKVTLTDDPTGLSFVAPGPNGFASCEHGVIVNQGKVVLMDREERAEMPASPTWGPLRDSPVSSLMPQAMGWRELFDGPPPDVKPAQAFSAVLLYPDDDREIEEVPTQPFVADYIQDMLEQRPELAASLSKADRILIHSFDAAVASCINVDRPRDYTILYHRPEFAQKQAQVLWSPLAQTQQLACARGIEFLPAETYVKAAYEQQYDLIYRWVLFAHFDQPTKLSEAIASLVIALKPGGLAFVVAPPTLDRIARTQGLRVLHTDAVETLPTFGMHRTILPKARIKAGLTLYQVAKT